MRHGSRAATSSANPSYEHVAIDAERPDGTHVITFRDVAYDPDDGAVYGVCMEPVARMGMRSGELRWRISGVRTGKRELVAEYESRPV